MKFELGESCVDQTLHGLELSRLPPFVRQPRNPTIVLSKCQSLRRGLSTQMSLAGFDRQASRAADNSRQARVLRAFHD